MRDVFQIKTDDLKKLIKRYPLNAKEFRLAQLNVLNSQAFGSRLSAIEVIQKRMIVRNPRFVQTSLRVEKASMKTKMSTMGSIRRQRFSGWIEQQTGQEAERNRIPTKAARRGNIRNRIAPLNRLRPSNVFISDVKKMQAIKSPNHRVYAMLDYVRRKKYSRPFMLSGNKRYLKGLYRRIKGRIRFIQHIGDIDKSVSRLMWIDMAVMTYFKANPQKRVWKTSVKRIVKFRKR